MQELINQLKTKFNLSDEQCNGVIQTVANFVKEKFPMAAGVMDNIMPGNKSDDKTTDTDAVQAVAGGGVPTVEDAANKLKGFL